MTAAIDRLRLLPDVFNATSALLVTGIPKEQFNQYMWRWQKAGLVRTIGARSDVWINLLRVPELSHEIRMKAIRMALPDAIVAGHGVLQRHGLSTQMANRIDMIRPVESAKIEIDGVVLHERPKMWIKTLRRVGAVNEDGPLPELDPGAALVDLLRFDPESIDMDDMDWEELLPEARQQSLQIFNALADYAGVEVPAPTRETPRG
ncbi:hypothetical protein [uncultured Variovorax sp.]|uniref:hypothetical protein n=1 Tax=uncultured Variovorax sp. TaxID=114708 RepID=UPI0026122375|nr:hypothetical protein [uncultured Variovorax sp.]